MKRINKKVNQNLKNPTTCLNANKICQNISKTEVVLFKSAGKETDTPLKLKLYWKRLCPVKEIDEKLNWKQQFNHLPIRLNRENAILSKLRHFIDRKTLKAIYHLLGHKIKI